MFSLGDLASAFGCTVGLKDAVTAITLVALGTSLPDTFASKVAAVNDKFADSSVGNVTGSNAVNVFLGVGVAWFTAAVYHEVKGMLNFRTYFKKKTHEKILSCTRNCVVFVMILPGLTSGVFS